MCSLQFPWFWAFPIPQSAVPKHSGSCQALHLLCVSAAVAQHTTKSTFPSPKGEMGEASTGQFWARTRVCTRASHILAMAILDSREPTPAHDFLPLRALTVPTAWKGPCITRERGPSSYIKRICEHTDCPKHTKFTILPQCFTGASWPTRGSSSQTVHAHTTFHLLWKTYVNTRRTALSPRWSLHHWCHPLPRFPYDDTFLTELQKNVWEQSCHSKFQLLI